MFLENELLRVCFLLAPHVSQLTCSSWLAKKGMIVAGESFYQATVNQGETVGRPLNTMEA